MSGKLVKSPVFGITRLLEKGERFMAIKFDDAIDSEKDGGCYVAPDGKVFEVRESNLGSDNCLLAGCGSLENEACTSLRNGMLLVLDGSRLLRRVGRLIEKGAIDPETLPLMIGVDPADV